MFKSARIKLTAYYLGIIMVIMLFISFLIYRGFLYEFRRGLRLQISQSHGVVRDLPAPLGIFITPPEFEPFESTDILQEAKTRVLFNLAVINLTVLFISGAGGYFLAGRTLKPIEEMVEDQKRFVSDASHELKTPLTAIKSEIEVNLRDKKMKIGQAKELLKSNLEEVEKMQKLSNYLLSLSRYQQGKTKIKLEKIDLGKAALSAIDKEVPLAKAKKIKISSKVKKIFIKGDLTSIEQLTGIFLDNAIKYSPSGKKVIVSVYKKGKNAFLSIKDFGIGIRASEIPFIFNRFYRSDLSRSKIKADGYGLGLSIAKNIVSMHHGDIKVSSKLSKGSEFVVKFHLA